MPAHMKCSLSAFLQQNRRDLGIAGAAAFYFPEIKHIIKKNPLWGRGFVLCKTTKSRIMM